MRDQQDLETLCAARPNIETLEVHEPNAYYGHAAILKAYAGWPARRPLPLGVPHGVEAGVGYPTSYHVRERVPVVTYTEPYRREVNLASGVTARQWPMAMPYLFLLELLRDQPAPARSGTIFFPSHSTTGHTVDPGWEQLAATIHERFGDDLTVCIYFQDYLRGHHRPFEARGSRIVSAGHPYDPLFLVRFHHLCSLHEVASTNDVGSAPFYAAASGCRYVDVNLGVPGWSVAPDGAQPPQAVHSAMKDVLIELAAADDPTTVSDRVLGRAHLHDPATLRRMLWQAWVLDWVLPTVERGRRLPTPPPRARRALRRLRRATS